MTHPAHAPPKLAIILAVVGFLAISVNDMLIKFMSGGFPLHEVVFLRSAIAMIFTFVLLHREGGLALLKTDHPWLHMLRAMLIVIANMTFFAGLAILPLADATAVFFVAPLIITVMSAAILKESVGPRRLAAVAVGFLGVAIMWLPVRESTDAPGWALLLPICAAVAYAANQILTRLLGSQARASAMAIYVHAGFIAVSLLFWGVAGDGRFSVGLENESLIFLLRAWIWPSPEDWLLLGLVGVLGALMGYCLTEAYRSAEAATIAPLEYVVLPLSVFWGWLVFGQVPVPMVVVGIILIAFAGLYVFFREARQSA